MTAFSADSIESTTVVGYQQIATPQGFSMRSATFKATSGDLKISDITVTGAGGAGGDYVQKINADGTWGEMYCYLTMEGSGWLEDGWYLGDQETPVSDDDVLKKGEALMVTAASDISFTFAGEVIAGTPNVSVLTGFSMKGNPLPNTIKISEIKVTGAGGAGGDYVQKINADGTWGEMYCYLTMEGSGWLEDGWYLGDQETPVSDTDVLKPGEGLMVTASADLTITFPAAL